MSRPWRAAALMLALAALGAGCGSAAGHAAGSPTTSRAAAPGPQFAPLSLSASLNVQGATWAVVPMGATGPNLFWQLFVLPAAGTRWSLATPPDIATNGAIVLGGLGGHALVTGIRASLNLTFSPVSSTADGGRNWVTSAPVAAGLADVPDALAAAPDGRMIALARGGQVLLAGPGGASWTTLASEPSIAAAPAARGCALTALTAAAFTPAGVPLLAGTCTRAGTVGILARRGGTWQAAGPALPASLAGQEVNVLRLIRTGAGDAALLQAGTGSAASLLAAWTADGGDHWSLSAPFRLDGSQVRSASFGKDGAAAVALTGGRDETIAGPGDQWRQLPVLPPGRAATLTLPAAGTLDALIADGSTLTAWWLAPGSATWARAQTIHVPIQYGSSS